MNRKPERHWRESMKNGLRNTPTPWNAGTTTGMLFRLFLSFQQQSERSFTRRIPLNRWMQHTANWTARGAYFRVILHCKRHCICPLLKLPRNGLQRFEIGRRYMENWVSCTRDACQNNTMKHRETDLCSWHAIISLLYIKTRRKAYSQAFRHSLS